MKRKSKLRERICAFLLALLLPLTSVLPNVTLVASAEGDAAATDITFTVTDEASNPLEGVHVEIYLGDSEEVSEPKTTDASGKAVFSLDDVDAYQFKATKETYNPERKTVKEVLSGTDAELTLHPMAEIEINLDGSGEIEKDKNLQLGVKNPVDYVTYKWSSSEPTIAEVDESTGMVTGISRGTADITVSGNGKEQTKKVAVFETPEMILTATPNQGTNIDSVDLDVQLPKDANGTVTFYKDPIDTSNKIDSALIADGKASITVNVGSLLGNQTFWAVYSGSADKYYLESTVNTTGKYLQKYPLEFDETGTEVTYGDGSFKVPLKETSLMGRTGLTYESLNPQVATVNATGEVTIVGIGEAEIVVSVDESDQYTASSEKYPVTVKPKDLGTVTLSDFVWQSVNKVYDRTTEVPVLTGKLTSKENSGILAGEELVITAKADVVLGANKTKADVGIYDKCEIINVTSEAYGNYTLTLDKSEKEVSLENGNQVEIKRRPVFIKVGQQDDKYVEVPYGSTLDEIKAAVEKAEKEHALSIELAGKNGQITDNTEQGLLEGDTLTLINYAKIVLNGTSFYVKDYDSAIRPEVTKAQAGNYEVSIDSANIETYSARLRITQETVSDEELWNRLELDADNSDHVFEAGGVIWISASGKAAFRITDQTFYNKIHIKNSGTEVPNHILKIKPDSVKEGTITDAQNEIYLSSQGQLNTRTTSGEEKDQNNKIPKGAVKIDNQIPTVDFHNLKLSSVLEGKPLSFTKFTKSTYTETVEISDGVGSGVEKSEYSLLAIKPTDNVSDKVNNAATAPDTKWTAITGSQIEIPASPEGYYIVLVKASDKIGNTAVYASNGLVVEISKPDIQLEITSKPSEHDVYKDNVDYKLQVTDPETVQSGINEIKVQVQAGAQEVEGNKTTYTNSYTLDNNDLNQLAEVVVNKNSYTFDQIAKKSSYEITGTLKADECNSNQVKITVTAYDQAGNSVKEESSELSIDTIQPEITVSYDNNAPEEETYFRDNRTMTIEYKERNFQENLAVFEFSTDGGKTTETKTLSELGSVDGVTVKRISDTQETLEEEERTDERTITYEIEFNGGTNEDIDYVIKPAAEDMAGNKNKPVVYETGTVAGEAFTVDKTAPVIEISYDNNKVMNGRYFKENRKMTITYTERNFTEKGLTFDEGSDQFVSLEALNAIEGISVEPKEGTDADKHTYEISFGEEKKDIDFKLIPHATDKAGNETIGAKYKEGTEASEEFTVDRVAPEMSVKYYTFDENGNKIADIAEGDISTGRQDSMYKNEFIAAEVTITERNFAAGDTFTEKEMKVIETATDVEGAVVNQADHNGSAQIAGNWVSSQDSRTQTFLFQDEANYTFNITYVDEAGNEASLVKGDAGACHYFTVDKTAPSGEVKVDESVYDKLLNFITFGFFNKKEITYKTAAEDKTSPVKISYYKHYPGRDVRGSFASLSEEEIKAVSDWTKLTGYDVSKTMSQYYEYKAEKTEQIVPYEKIEDKAGNITYLNADGAICEEKEAEIKINITTDAPSTSFIVEKKDVIYNSDVSFTIDVKDTAVKDAKGRDVYSGLKHIEYGVYVNGQPGPVSGTKDFDPEARQESYSIDVDIPSESYNSNDVMIKVKAFDNAGNESNMSKALKIDITNPKIDVEYDNNDAANEKYFKENRTMTITYTERNINRDGVTFDFNAGEKPYSNITLKELEEIADQSGIKILRIVDSEEGQAAEKFSDNRTLTCEIEFTGSESKDLDYSITPHIEDQASNKNTDVAYKDGTKAPVEFTVDKVKPTLDVEYYLVNGNDLEKLNISTDEINRLYKNKTIRAVAKVKERNFSLKDSFSKELKQVVPYFTWKMDDGSQGNTKDFESAAKERGMWKPAGSADSYEWIQTFDFAADGDYSFRMEYTDLAGNALEKSYDTHYFTVDKTVPEIAVTYEAEGEPVTAGDVEKNRLYRNKTITATVQITERNFQRGDQAEAFEKGQMNLTYEALDTVSQDVAIENYTKSADTRGKWTSEGYVRTQVFTFVNDANYQLALTYKDLAGNKVDYGTHYFTVDKTAPTGEIKVNEGIWNRLFEMVFFNIFTGSTQDVELTSSDITAGVASTQYYKYVPDAESRYTFKALTWAQLDNITNWTDGYHTSVDANEQVIVYEKIVDRAGNVTYLNAQEGVIADSEKPQAPEIKITIAEPSQGIYNSDVPFTIDVTDPEAGGTYSGLKTVEYQVLRDGNESQSGNYNAELSDSTARVQSIHHSETVYAKMNNSNHVTIKVRAVDYAGNFSEAEKDIKIDITKPEVQITYDLNNPSNGRYYNATRTATVSVKERNFDPDAVDFTITNTDGTMPAISGWNISPAAGETDEAVNTCTVSFAADGDYTITMNCTDRANNRSEYTQVDEFTIDQTAPTISVAYDNNSAANGTYYDKPRTATITVNEHNFNGSEVQAAISASLQSQGISTPGVNGWSTSGDSHTATINFAADGDYSFTINYTDLAGNPATAYTQDKFTVDQTKPEIEIFDIKDKSANNGVVAPGVKYSDVNYDASAVKLTIKGPKHSERTVSGTRSSIPNGESIKMADFERKESVDDVYTLTAQVTDMAGNTDEKSVMFSVNRFGSNFIFGDATKAFLDQYYSNQEQDLIVTEINVDTLVHNGISYGLDGELVNLEKGKDYTVKESGNEASWKSYQYTMKASNFEREGLYNITIDSKDRANNEVNNKVKESDIEFVIDKTKPTVVITGVENDGQYRTNSRDITITVADNVAMDSLKVDVDGKENTSKNYNAKEILKQKGEIPFSLTDSSNWQEIRALATDAAGNTAETSEIRVLITANLLVQFYRNTPLVVGSSVGLAALVAVLVILISRKKKTNRKPAEK